MQPNSKTHTALPQSKEIRPPFVTVVMPIRNETAHIGALIEQLFAQDYPADRYEVIVADGMSTDGTREILSRLMLKYSQLRMIDNPAKIVPTGLNAAIRAARGSIIVRVDGHVALAPDFVRTSIELLQATPEAWAVGGPIVHAGESTFGNAAAVAMSSRFGVGNATHRFADYEGFGEGTAFPAFHKWVFDRIGYFDEALVRNQDDEFNFRIAQAGGKFYISPRIRYRYFVRDTLPRLARQYFQYSFWRIPVMRKHRRPTTLRQIIPLLFFLTMAAFAVLGVYMHIVVVATCLPLAYLFGLIGCGLAAVPQAGIRVAVLVPIAIATLHVSYAAGMLYGFLSALFRPRAFAVDGSMTRLSR